MSKFKVYLITNIVTQKQYIGITTKSIKFRFEQHCYKGSNCKHLYHSIKKHGKNQFIIDLLHDNLNRDTACILESKEIIERNTLTPNGYNLTTGGIYCEMSDDTKAKMSANTSKRWKENPEALLKGFNKCKEYVNNKKKAVVGVDIKTGEITKFSNVTSTGVDVSACLSGKTHYNGGKCWFYDKNQTNEELIMLTEQKLGCKIGEYFRGKNSWSKSNKKQRSESISNGLAHYRKAIIGVSIIDGNVVRYKSISDAKRDKFAGSSIMHCLNKTTKVGQNYCWFYDNKEDDSFYINNALLLIGNFKTERTKPFYGVNGNIQIHFNCASELKETQFQWKGVNRSIKEGRSYLGYVWFFKN
jgi:hypothetical protein